MMQHQDSASIRIAFIVLAHEPPRQLVPLIEVLAGVDEDISVWIHYDASSPDEHFRELSQRFSDSPRTRLLSERVKCGWGEFGLVEAALRALNSIAQSTPHPDRVYLLSGSCFPIRPIAELQNFLEAHPETEFIEAHPESWIVGGLAIERYERYHWVNERKYRGLFYASEYVQRKLGIKRRFPEGLTPRFGSQWWCLSWRMCQDIMKLIDDRPDIYRFFKTTWIPDELFFQTLAYALAPTRLNGRSLTYYRFSNQAKPMVFHDDHTEALKRLPFFFARKISVRASKLRSELLGVAKLAPPAGAPIELGDPLTDFDISDRVAAQVTRPKPNQIYYGDQLRGQWQGILRALQRPIIVLYGPPSLTRMAGENLARDPRFTIFGRLLSAERVDFGAFGSDFGGLHSSDVKIRDYDRANYLARVFARTDGVPVFQMSPLDYPEGQGMFHADERVIFLMCTPAGLRRPRDREEDAVASVRRRDWLRFFWALTVSERGDLAEGPPATAKHARQQLDDYAKRALWKEHVGWVEDRLRELDYFTRGTAPLYWDVGPSRADDESGGVGLWPLSVDFQDLSQGSASLAKTVGLRQIRLSWAEALAPLPPRARSAISAVFGREDEPARETMTPPAFDLVGR